MGSKTPTATSSQEPIGPWRGWSKPGSSDASKVFSSLDGKLQPLRRIPVGLEFYVRKEDRADPRHFTFGFNFRKTFLRINNQDLNAIKSALYANTTVLSDNRDLQGEALRAVRNVQNGSIRAFLWDNALRFEGNVKGGSIGNVSNLLLDSQLQIATVTRAFARDTGFFNLRLIPLGVEAGHNLTNEDNPTQEKNSLARIKAGGVLMLVYEARNPKEFLNRVEFETQAATRYLFRRESAFDETTRKVVLTDKGNKYWLQSNLKFLFSPRIGQARAGFRLSFNRGSLPPIYSFTKSFNFGVVLETTDDSTAKEIEK